MGKKTVAGKRPPRKREAQQTVRQTKKQIALSRKEARQLRVIWLSVGALGLVLLLILGFAVVSEALVKPSRPVALVNDTKIPLNRYEDLLTYRRYNLHSSIERLNQELKTLDPNLEENQFLLSFYGQQLQQLESYLNTVPQTVLDEMIEDALIREKAQEIGVAVTAQEVTQAINDMINNEAQSSAAASSSASITNTAPIPTPTPLSQADVDKIYKDALEAMKLSDKAFRTIVEHSLLRQKVQDFLAGQVMTTGLIVHVQMVQADSQEEADMALKRIESGEDFALVAREVSTDTQTTETGGDLGWVAAGQLSSRYGEEVDTAIFSMAVGTARVVESNGRFYLIRVVERNENGPLPAEVVSSRRNSALSDWLTERKASPDVKIERLLQTDQIPADPFTQS